MRIISTQEFNSNPLIYFDLAETEQVIIHEGKKLVELVVKEKLENPSPSNDPWFDDPENMKSLLRGIQEWKEGKAVERSVEEIEEFFGI